jgi:hypothetical protein
VKNETYNHRIYFLSKTAHNSLKRHIEGRLMHKFNIAKLAKISLIIFAILTAASAFAIYHTYQLPTYEMQINTLCSYQHVGTYNYVAKLKPNLIYNKTTLNPGEGTLYTAIVEYINLTFNYAFTYNPQPENTAVNHKTEIQMESPEKWLRTLQPTEAKEILLLERLPCMEKQNSLNEEQCPECSTRFQAQLIVSSSS